MPNISNAQSSILDHKNISLVFVGVLDYSNCPDDGWPKDFRYPGKDRHGAGCVVCFYKYFKINKWNQI